MEISLPGLPIEELVCIGDLLLAKEQIEVGLLWRISLVVLDQLLIAHHPREGIVDHHASQFRPMELIRVTLKFHFLISG